MKLIFTFFILSVFVSDASHSQEETCFFKPVLTSNCKTSSQTPGTTIVFRCGAGRTSTGVEPFLFIDGVVSDFNELKNINPNDIASIEILKESSQVAIYGNRGYNGVILITTKGAHLRKFVVKDFLTGEKIPGATICFRSNLDSITTVANEDGILLTDKLKMVGQYSMTVSSAGYKTFSTSVGGKVQEISLERDVKSSPEVVVVGYPVFRCGRHCPKTGSVSDCELKYVVDTAHIVAGVAITKTNKLISLIYPNPVVRNKPFTIQFECDYNASLELVVFAMNGQQIFRQSQKGTKALNHFSVIADAELDSRCLYCSVTQ